MQPKSGVVAELQGFCKKNTTLYSLQYIVCYSMGGDFFCKTQRA